jgi:hypothetical protein
MIDKEIHLIYSVLRNSEVSLTTQELARILRDKHNLKISKTIVKNYLWSYFRDIIDFDKENFTYSLSNTNDWGTQIELTATDKTNRPIEINMKGVNIEVIYSHDLTIEKILDALAKFNFTETNKLNYDFIKKINRIIESNINV